MQCTMSVVRFALCFVLMLLWACGQEELTKQSDDLLEEAKKYEKAWGGEDSEKF